MGSHSFSEMAEPKVKVTTLFYYIYKYYLKFNRQFCWSMNKLTTKNRQNIFIGYKQWKLAKIVIKNKVKDMNKRTMENRENIFKWIWICSHRNSYFNIRSCQGKEAVKLSWENS